MFRSKIKWAALGGLILSVVSLVVHLILAKYSTVDLAQAQRGLAVDVFDDPGLSVTGKPVILHFLIWVSCVFYPFLH